MSVRTARTWEQGPLPSATKAPRSWRTRRDPFAEVWESQVVPLLGRDDAGILEATTVLDVLVERWPERYRAGHLRTLQRRLHDWRALHGPPREVFFEQTHEPGREAAIDFTHATELGVTIAGRLLRHLLFQFVLCASGWRWVMVAFGETFEALVAGVQGALWALGAVPAVLRSDNLSAATHELKRSGGRALTARFQAVLDHYAMTSTRIRPGGGAREWRRRAGARYGEVRARAGARAARASRLSDARRVRRLPRRGDRAPMQSPRGGRAGRRAPPLDSARLGDPGKRLPVALKDRRVAGECLPPSDGDIDVPGLDLERVAAPPELGRRDQGRPAAQEQIEHNVARRAHSSLGG
jgi:hypothetical protein